MNTIAASIRSIILYSKESKVNAAYVIARSLHQSTNLVRAEGTHAFFGWV